MAVVRGQVWPIDREGAQVEGILTMVKGATAQEGRPGRRAPVPDICRPTHISDSALIIKPLNGVRTWSPPQNFDPVGNPTNLWGKYLTRCLFVEISEMIDAIHRSSLSQRLN